MIDLQIAMPESALVFYVLNSTKLTTLIMSDSEIQTRGYGQGMAESTV